MAIIAKNKNITENIEDEKGNILGSISYNPEDIKSYRILVDIINLIDDMSKNAKNINKLEIISDAKIDSVEDFEKYSSLFKECQSDFHSIDNGIELIKTNIDEIFGQGTSQILMGDGHDVELLMPLLNEVMPKFKEKRENKLDSYLNDGSQVI